MFFVPEDIPAKLIVPQIPSVERPYMEVKLRKQKWLISYSYNPNKFILSQHINALGHVKIMVTYFSTYEKFVFLGDFNAGMEHSALKDLFNVYSLTSMINSLT